MLEEDFDTPDLSARWTRTCPGGGTVACASSLLRLSIPPGVAGRYADAQIDDYARLRRSRFPWRPPLRLDVRARASHPQAHHPSMPGHTAHEASALEGTAGFGFWNYPFSLSGSVLTLPDAVWFFYASPPSNMALVPGSSGWGWKAQVIHAHRWGSIALSAPTAAAVMLARVSGREAAASRWIQRLSGTFEAHLMSPLTEWHAFAVDWYANAARFYVNDRLVLEAPAPPGPLGFVAWIDNQFAVATPRGTLRFGTMTTRRAQWLELDHIRVTPL